jgi:hypothetical protein
MHTAALNLPKNRLNNTGLMVRLMLQQEEVFRLPAASRSVQVVAGAAWLTVAGKDIFLKRGESIRLLTDKEMALVSALGQPPLILEVFGDSTSTTSEMVATPCQSRSGAI